MRGPSKPTSSPNVRKPARPIFLRYLGLPATQAQAHLLHSEMVMDCKALSV